MYVKLLETIFLVLPLVHLFYVNTSEFKKRYAYYFRCYAISSAPVKVKWMFKNCPSGNPFCKGSYEQLLVRVFKWFFFILI